MNNIVKDINVNPLTQEQVLKSVPGQFAQRVADSVNQGAGPGYAFVNAMMPNFGINKNTNFNGIQKAQEFFRAPNSSQIQPPIESELKKKAQQGVIGGAAPMGGDAKKEGATQTKETPKPGQPEGVLDQYGFYTVRGDDGSSAKVLDWNIKQKDSFLTPEAFQNQLAAGRLMEMQNEMTTPGYSEAYASGKHGNSASIEFGAKRPDMPNIGGGNNNADRIAWEREKLAAEQAQEEFEPFKTEQDYADYSKAVNDYYGDNKDDRIAAQNWLSDKYKRRFAYLTKYAPRDFM